MCMYMMEGVCLCVSGESCRAPWEDSRFCALTSILQLEETPVFCECWLFKPSTK